jgi:putative transposase
MAKNVNMRTLFHCVYELTYHLVLVTKYRRKCITRPMLDMLQDIVAQRCKGWGGELLEFNGEPDHVRVLMSQPQLVALRQQRGDNQQPVDPARLRSGTARRVPQARVLVAVVLRYRVRGAPLSVIKQYVEQQASPD